MALSWLYSVIDVIDSCVYSLNSKPPGSVANDSIGFNGTPDPGQQRGKQAGGITATWSSEDARQNPRMSAEALLSVQTGQVEQDFSLAPPCSLQAGNTSVETLPAGNPTGSKGLPGGSPERCWRSGGTLIDRPTRRAARICPPRCSSLWEEPLCHLWKTSSESISVKMQTGSSHEGDLYVTSLTLKDCLVQDCTVAWRLT